MKTIEPPIGLEPAEVDQILIDVAGLKSPAARIDRISETLLGRKYVEGWLGGGPELPEQLRVSLNAFDCVTFLEVVLALALAHTFDEFTSSIRRIRYENGDVDWFRRNHYMTDWASNNEECGFISNLTTGPETFEKICKLSLIAGLPAKTATLRYFPTERWERIAGSFQTGDLILFVSTRETLDVFHTGFVIVRDGRWLVRHATRTAGAVIDQDLGEFVSKNEMAGFVQLRPLCRP